jgi:phospholipid/cholesterol/gamma-HCH transport system ATP-binding protein
MSLGTGDVSSHIVFQDVDMAFGGRKVFDHLSWACARGEITGIHGGTGAGKSTVLRLIGGLVQPLAGRILVDGQDVTRLSERQMYAVREKIGMMFQAGALLDSMSVYDNLAFPLREHSHLGEAEIHHEVHERLESVDLHGVDDLLPSQLSGGMKKRVALARAIIKRPVVLLCDEPFSGLDPISTRRIESLLERINEQYGMTIVAVSHHIASTMRMAAQVLVLLPNGAMMGTPAELEHSSDPRVVSFLRADVDESIAEALANDSVPAHS